MKSFLKTKAGIFMVGLFVCMMAFAFYRVSQRQRAREAAAMAEQTRPALTEATNALDGTPMSDVAAAERSQQQMQQAAYIGSYRQNAGQSHEEQDRSGNPRTRRATAAKPHEAGTETVPQASPSATREPVAAPPHFTLRLQGRSATPVNARHTAVRSDQDQEDAETTSPLTPRGKAPRSPSVARSAGPAANADPATLSPPNKPRRFLPFGYPIKCELVFTIDSANGDLANGGSTKEDSKNGEVPLIGLVVAPAYSNGQLIVPAGAELHGSAGWNGAGGRLYSSEEWVLVFPREGNKPNGRQLKVRGMALDRIQPDDNGMTWGITDGSFGLQGEVICPKINEEVQQFAATALEAAAAGLQTIRQVGRGQQIAEATPRNALFQGVGADMHLMVEKARIEIERNRRFIRVPAGKQFYFYPQQVIDPDLADISSNIASVQ